VSFRTITWFTSLLIALSVMGFGQEKAPAIIAGVIQDDAGVLLPMVNVQIEGTSDGDATDVQGRFVFATRTLGKRVLRASLIGYEPISIPITLSMHDSVFLRITMDEAVVRMGEVLVTGSAYTIGDDPKALAIHSLDIVTTAGASADVLRAIQTLPGVVPVDEGAGLFVRGGDVTETSILLDQATVVHPYKFESPTGGYFGTIPPFLLGGTFFSSGGFPSRYGNALSGVLAMESMNMPATFTMSAGVGLAAGSLGAAIPIIPNSLGLRVSCNKSFADAMLRMNGSRGNFNIPPDGFDGNLSLIWKYSPNAQIKLLSFVSGDRIGVHTDEPSFAGIYASHELNRLYNLQLTATSDRWLCKGSLSVNQFETEQELGSYHLRPSDISYKARFDADGDLDDRHHLFAGAECEKMTNRFEGTVPMNPMVLDPAASTYLLDEEQSAVRVGVYAELESRVSQRMTANLGLRSDYHGLAHQAVLDPRVSLRYDISKEMNARLGWGIYHQFPQPYLYNAMSGDPHLSAQRSQHLIAGVEYSRELVQCRMEAYRKTYAQLVLRTASSHYANMGDGVASGIDVFLKYGGFLRTPVSGWISYSYIHARRLQARDLAESIVYEEAPSSFDITHNVTLVGKVQVIQQLSIGLTFRCATGTPVTPVVGAIRPAGADYYEPIQGSLNSERMPAFVRMDATLAYFQPFGESNAVMFYVGMTNVLDRSNPVRYEYSADYAQRRLKTTDYHRFIYFGTSISLGSMNVAD
jgi:vitamin B12 transporter